MKSTKLNFKKIFAALALSFFYGQAVLASTFDEVMKGFFKTGQEAGYPTTGEGVPAVQFAPAWVNYINGMLTLMGLLFMVNIIYAGYLWFMAHGKEEQVSRAKSMLINAVIGLVIIIGARVIVELSLFYLGQTVITG
jgi:hypothetical protein